MGDVVIIDNTGITYNLNTKVDIYGFGQIFTQALRKVNIDTNSGYAISAFKNWDVFMGHRVGGLVATDGFKVFTDVDALSGSAYELIFKKNQFAKNEWLQALRVSVVQIPPSALQKIEGVFVPSDDASNWVFRVEGYNNRYLPITFNSPTYDEFQTFNALSKANTDREWLRPLSSNGVVTQDLPIEITGLQNLVAFLFGYADYLDSRGWKFNTESNFNIDAVTGRVRNWQLEIEKVIDSIYVGVQLGQGMVVNPFLDKVWFKHDTGLVSKFEDTVLFDVETNAAIYDALGDKIPSVDLNVIRKNDITEISAEMPMFSAHVQLDEFEHIIIFNKFGVPSTQDILLYDPFSGSRVATYRFNGRRQASLTMRPEFGGHYLVGNEVRQNLQVSTDNFASFYDADKAFNNTKTTEHALALLGFNRKDYFSNLDISDKTQFNFWRGLVQSKGTNMSISAYLNNDRFDDAKVDEYWAYKVAEYGDARPRTYPELKLRVTDCLQQFTKLQFDAEEYPQAYDLTVFDSTAYDAEITSLLSFRQVSSVDENRWVSIDDIGKVKAFAPEKVGEVIVNPIFDSSSGESNLIELPFVPDFVIVMKDGQLVNYMMNFINASSFKSLIAGPLQVIGYGYSSPNYSPVKLFNYAEKQLVEEIPIWHPAVGIHSPIAMENINIISSKDPAQYNKSTLIIGNSNFDSTRPWGDNEVGRTWFNTKNLSYIPYADRYVFTEIDERLSRWGAISDFASVDVYEWVKSDVPPSEYDAKSVVDSANADIDASLKATGQVAIKETYSRDRQWQIRPLAWSFSPTGLGHPAFNDGFTPDLYIDESGVWLESSTFAERGIVSGMRVGGVVRFNDGIKPISEYEILSTQYTKILFDQNSTTSVGFTQYVGKVGIVLIGEVFVETVVSIFDEDGLPLEYTHQFKCVLTGEDGDVDVLTLIEITNTTPSLNNTYILNAGTYTFNSPVFGVTLTSTVDDIEIKDVFGGLTQFRMFDAVEVNTIVISDEPSLSNDETVSEIGWRAWRIPTQGELDSDKKSPTSKWKAYVGDWVNADNLNTIVSYKLNDGRVIDQTRSVWSEWKLLEDIKLEKVNTETQFATSDISIQLPSEFEENRTTVYVNGIAQLRSLYRVEYDSLLGFSVVVPNVKSGAKVTVIIRKIDPTPEQLEFNPDIQEDLTFDVQFKQDYQYVETKVRDSEGSITSSNYYFWVKNKTTVAPGKKLPVQTVARIILEGPTNYLTFHGYDINKNGYTAIAISGLNYLVTKDQAYKLRFTKDFTLRDNIATSSSELDLKNVHTEWALMRPGQTTKIPERLWNKLVDSMSGLDSAGNQVPSLKRVLYDERNGTSSRFGFGPEQTLAPSDFLKATVKYTILNTKLVENVSGTNIPQYIQSLDFSESSSWFADPVSIRKTMTNIWNSATPQQINEIFFAALNDMLAANFELTDIFKTSRLAAYSIKVVNTIAAEQTYE